MIRHCGFALSLCCLLALVSRAQGQSSISLSTHSSVNANGFVITECASVMNDANTKLFYPAVETQCAVSQNGTVSAFTQCQAGNPTASCFEQSQPPEVQGAQYNGIGAHGLQMFLHQQGCIQNGILIACWENPLLYGVPLSTPLPNCPASCNAVPNSSASALVNNTSDLGLAFTNEAPFTAMSVSPKAADLILGDQMTVTSSSAANWTLTGPGSILTATRGVSTVTYQTPAVIDASTSNAILTACNVNTSHGEDCAVSNLFLSPVHVTIQGPSDLIPNHQFQYTATVSAPGASHPFDHTVTWSIVNTPPPVNSIQIDPTTGVLTAPPTITTSEFFTIQACSNFDPSKCNTFRAHIGTVHITITPTFPVPFPDPLLAQPLSSAKFDATAVGLIGGYPIEWSGNLGSSPLFPDSSTGTLVFPAKPVVVNPGRITIIACILLPQGNSNTFVQLCSDPFFINVVPPVDFTVTPPTVNSGEEDPITITCTGCGTAPAVTGGGNAPVKVISITVAGDVTTINATVTDRLVLNPDIVAITVASSLPPPTLPARVNISSNPVTTIASISPPSASLFVSQQQQFIGSVGCLTAGQQPCAAPQGFACTLPAGSPGTMDPNTCLYTAPASIPAQTTFNAQACPNFGLTCLSVPITLIHTDVTISPANASLQSGQTQQFSAVVTGVPNGGPVTWTVSPSLGTITPTGLYTAPMPSVIGQQTVNIQACSTTIPTVCGTTAVTLQPTADLALSATPTSLMVPSTGGTFAYTLEAQYVNNLSGVLSVSVSGLPASVTSSFQYPRLSLVIPSGTPVGTYPFTVAVTAGAITRNIALNFSVVAAPDYTVSSQPSSSGQTISPGAAAGYVVNVSPVLGFADNVALTVTGVPSGATAAFSPSSVAGGSGASMLTVTTTSATPGGVYSISVTGTSGPLSHTQNLFLVVDPAADYSVLFATTPPTQISQSGSWGLAVGNVKALFSGLVQFSVSGLPAGITSNITNPSVSGVQLGTVVSTLTLTVDPSVANGTYSATINATSGTTTHATVITFSVLPFVLVQTGASGFTFNYSVASRPGYTGTISLSASGGPPGTIVTFTPAQQVGPNDLFNANVSFGSSLAPGNYSVTISGSDGTNTASSTQSFIILGSPTFTVPIINPATTNAGAAATFAVGINPSGGFGGTVTFGVSGLPAGATASFNPSFVTGAGSTTLTVSTATTTPGGNFPLTITATGGNITQSQTTTLTVNQTTPPPPDGGGGGGGCRPRCLNQGP